MIKLNLKRLISKLSTTKIISNRRILLLYHSVGDFPDAMNIALFIAQMKWLKNNCNVVSVNDLIHCSMNESDKPHVSITFDDGYASLFDIVMPILNEFNFSATVYLNTDWISHDNKKRIKSDFSKGHYRDEEFLTWSEVEALHNNGWIIGSHGANHLAHATLDQKDLCIELLKSKEIIEKMLGSECSHFAYTWGKHTKSLRNQVKKSGYNFAAAAHHKVLDDKDNNFSLPRMSISKDYNLNDFINIINGSWDYLGLYHALNRND